MKSLITALLICLSCFNTATQNDEGNDWLVHVKSTGRISSNHFSDFIVDNKGNSFIGSFFKGDDARDYIYIVKIAETGEILWERGGEYQGRATAISIDSKQHIWLVGFYMEDLRFGNQKLENDGSVHGFLASFDQNGQCLVLKKIYQSSLFNCHVNAFNEIIISGSMNDSLSIDGIELKQEGWHKNFIANFNGRGQCVWLEKIYSPSGIGRIRSDQLGQFYLAGGFNTRFEYQGNHLETEGQFDNDGFLLKIDRQGKKLSLNQFGNKGITRYGYRANEMVFDLAFDKNNDIILGVCFENMEVPDNLPLSLETRVVSINLVKLNKEGRILENKSLMKSTNQLAGNTLILSNEQVWLSGSTTGSAIMPDTTFNFAKPQSFLLQLNMDWNMQKQIWPEHGENTIFRVAYSFENSLFFSGHFQNHLKLNGLEATNDGNHGIFLYKFNEG